MIWKMFKMSIFQTELFDCLYRIYTFYFYYFTTILLHTFEDAHSPLWSGATMLILRPAAGQGVGTASPPKNRQMRSHRNASAGYSHQQIDKSVKKEEEFASAN